ncbi:glycine-rich secreted protein [Streptomyces sp. L-9-10]|uniref:DUF4232 domain-containing protein n=1 Tax=Streptomyces sp. L-9-10 TaxID=1478131 RepID=UPI00101C2D20|nr:DUF4232 domain-containing protein [Streptomyces sp. L-9-10]RYJ25802.1 glycine-rich secreted protein [Streptomyces sp. L-9-10]
MRVHKLTFAALAVVASLSLTACNEEDLTGQGSPSAGSTVSPSAGGSDQGGEQDSAGKSSGGQGPVAGNGSDGNGEIGKCRTDDLDITAADGTIGGDTEGTVAVELKNGGGRDCVLSAYAGVDLETSSGTLSAERTGQQADTSVLKDGESTFFGVTYPINESGGSGVRVTALVVTPPDETKSFSLEWPGSATLPVSDGSGSPVKVGPIGSAGQGGES